MSNSIDLSLLAVLYELNDREFKRKLTLFPEELRFYGILAGSIVGLENSKRVEETPRTVVQESEAFVGKLLSMIDPGQHEAFKDILEAHLLEALSEELRFCCANCRRFGTCLDLENLSVGSLFQRRISGEETDALKMEIGLEVGRALQRTPYVDAHEAQRLCRDFIHQHNASNLGELFGRYADIAAVLQKDFGIDNRKIVGQMVSINMRFCEALNEQAHCGSC